MTKKIRVCHIITNLAVGGAQTMLVKLLAALDRDQFEPSVITMIGDGPVTVELQELNIPVHSLNMRAGIPDPWALFRLVRFVRQFRPDLIQSWMYHANLIASLAAPVCRRPPVVWNIRQSALTEGIDKQTTFWTVKLGAKLSRHFASRIIVNSNEGLQSHQKAGYAAEKLNIIPNGFDLERFQPSEWNRAKIRRELGISNHTPLVGWIGRFHPHKDPHNFVRATQQILQSAPQTHFMMCGNEITWSNRELCRWIDQAGCRRRMHLLGRRDDIPSLHASLDLYVLSSCMEGFPNVVGEAMASAVPAVVTDVGDSALLVGTTGKVVPPHNHIALAAACSELLQISGDQLRQMGQKARMRIEENYSLPIIAEQYANLWQNILQRRTSKQIQEKAA